MTDLSAAPARESAWEYWWDGAAEWVTGTGNTEGLGLLAFCAGWDAAASHILAEHLKDANRERDLVHSDLGDLLEACGLGNYARPESSHEVMQQAIAKVRGLRAEAFAEIRQLATDCGAEYRTPPCTNPGCPAVVGEHVHKLPFADLIGDGNG